MPHPSFTECQTLLSASSKIISHSAFCTTLRHSSEAVYESTLIYGCLKHSTQKRTQLALAAEVSPAEIPFFLVLYAHISLENENRSAIGRSKWFLQSCYISDDAEFLSYHKLEIWTECLANLLVTHLTNWVSCWKVTSWAKYFFSWQDDFLPSERSHFMLAAFSEKSSSLLPSHSFLWRTLRVAVKRFFGEGLFEEKRQTWNFFGKTKSKPMKSTNVLIMWIPEIFSTQISEKCFGTYWGGMVSAKRHSSNQSNFDHSHPTRFKGAKPEQQNADS